MCQGEKVRDMTCDEVDTNPVGGGRGKNQSLTPPENLPDKWRRWDNAHVRVVPYRLEVFPISHEWLWGHDRVRKNMCECANLGPVHVSVMSVCKCEHEWCARVVSTLCFYCHVCPSRMSVRLYRSGLLVCRYITCVCVNAGQ